MYGTLRTIVLGRKSTHRVSLEGAFVITFEGRRRSHGIAHDDVLALVVLGVPLTEVSLRFQCRHLVGVAESATAPVPGRITCTAEVPAEAAIRVTRRIANGGHTIGQALARATGSVTR